MSPLVLSLCALLGVARADDGVVTTTEHADATALGTWLASTHADIARRSTWLAPTEPERVVTALAVRALVRALDVCDAGVLSDVQRSLARAGLTLSRHTVGTDVVLVVTELLPHGAGMSAWRCGEALDVIAQAPHAFYDLDTGDIVRAAFVFGGLRGVMWNTVHRYRATPGELPEDPVHPADVAHQPTALFQTWTLAALAVSPGLRVVQLHGFATSTSTADAVLSSGSADRPPVDLREVAGAALVPEAPVVRIFGDDTDVLGGTTNVQARALVPLRPARFVHVELSPRARKALAADPTRAVRFLVGLGSASWLF